MIIADLSRIEGRRYPARRRTQNLVGGASPIQAANFAIGHVTLDPDGGQVPWHNQEQEEIYFVLEGTGEMCLGEERQIVTAGQAVYIPPGVFHQLTNIGAAPLRMIYCYGPAGDVAHWRQELAGTLPRAGVEAPPLPEGAHRNARKPIVTRSGSEDRRVGPASLSDAPAHLERRIGGPALATRSCPTIRRNHMETVTTHKVGIIMNGVTGRMGTNQHLLRSIMAIREQGGVKLGADEVIMPDPILVGRNAAKLAKLSEANGRRELDDQPRRAAGRPAVFDLLRRPDHRPPRGRRDPGHRRRQARLLREADGDHHGRGAGALPARQGRGA